MLLQGSNGGFIMFVTVKLCAKEALTIANTYTHKAEIPNGQVFPL